MEAGKHVHIEKPHVVSQEQLDRLIAAMERFPRSKVFLGFNRSKGRLFGELRAALAAEPGPSMINWFIGGHEIPEDHWYFDEREGGRVLGNLCHWTDLTLQLVSIDKAFPCTIVPATPPNAKSDFVVSLMFADGSCGAITFSAKGHAFEGVREVLNVHKGDSLANLTDFQILTIDVVEKKRKVRLRHRDHGHEANIVNSLSAALSAHGIGESPAYVAATARLFLAVREAIDSGKPVNLSVHDMASPAVIAAQ
jgi:predicted dehydrogenase